MKNTVILVCFAMTLGNAFCQDAKYLCIPDKKTGFAYSNGNWSVASFKDDEKYIVHQVGNKFTFNYFGSEAKDAFSCNRLSGYDLIECNSILRVLLDLDIKKFQIYFPLGYLARDGYGGKFSPTITIGKCSKI